MRTVKDLSIEELKTIIGEVVEEKLRELLMDLDAAGSQDWGISNRGLSPCSRTRGKIQPRFKRGYHSKSPRQPA